MFRSSILKALNDGIEEIDAIQAKTQINVNTMLATLLELKFAGTVVTIKAEIYMLSAEMGFNSYRFK